jgi:FkbM family methyltransferase
LKEELNESELTARLSGIENKLEEAFDRLSRLAVVERRLEEGIAYFAARSNRLVGSQSIYLGDHTAVTFLQNGLRILVDTRSMDVGIHLLTLGAWEPNYMALFDKLVKSGDTVLDIGANHGVYALHAAMAVGPKGKVHAFEPNPRLARLVDFSMKLNGFGDYATLHSFAVSDAAGTARLVFSDAFSGGGAISGNQSNAAQPGVECNLVALDVLFADPDFKVDVIKMDVEGHEGLALRGMQQLLKRSPNVKIMMEFGPDMMARAGVGAEEILAMLGGIGFKIWVIGAGGELHATSAADLLASSDAIQNILLAREIPRIFV